MPTRNPHLAMARILDGAGGTLVGRTRLEKITYLAQLGGIHEV